MDKIIKNQLKNGSRIEDAMDLFKNIIEHNKLEKHTINGWGPVYLPYLTDPMGWLGIWMLKSDELSATILKCRLWDSIYIKDSECVQTIRPINRNEVDKYSPEYDSYDNFALAEDIGIPFSLRYLIANMAFQDSIEITNNEVDIKPVQGFYDIKKELIDGDILPFHEPDKLVAFYFNKYICEINKTQQIKKPNMHMVHEV